MFVLRFVIKKNGNLAHNHWFLLQKKTKTSHALISQTHTCSNVTTLSNIQFSMENKEMISIRIKINVLMLKEILQLVLKK